MRVCVCVCVLRKSECFPFNTIVKGASMALTGIAVSHRSVAPGFKPSPDYVRRVFHFASFHLELARLIYPTFCKNSFYIFQHDCYTTGI